MKDGQIAQKMDASEVDVSSVSDGSSTSDSLLSQDDKHKQDLAGEETRTVEISKALVYLALLVAGITIGIATFFLTRRSETQTFENEFYGYAAEIIKSAESNLIAQVNNIRVLDTACTSHAYATNVAWPNFTLPDFVRRASTAFAGFGLGHTLALLPIVPGEQRSQYQSFANENRQWLFDGYAFEGRTNVSSFGLFHRLFNLDTMDLDERDQYVPLWQMAPTPAFEVININMDSLPWFGDLTNYVQRSGSAILSGFNDFLNSLPGEKEGVVRKRSVFLAPVFDMFPEVAATLGTVPKIVAYIMAVLPWESYFQKLLPDGVPSIIIEIDDNCGQIYSYEVAGSQGIILGNGTLHSDRYRDVYATATFAQFLTSSEKLDASEVDNCFFTILVYPTRELEDSYRDLRPFVYAFSITAVFLITLAMFAFYDSSVRRRQDVVLSVAELSSDIVASLFPKNIQERMMNEAKVKGRDNHHNSLLGSKKENFIQSQRSDGEVLAPHEIGTPIAELFPETTIMFGDLVGFTAWSSMQQPAQVFTLLETIYYEFDQIAKKRRIFKVETVGDCYVAVAGLPDPRPDHAVAMARFARDCREKLVLLIATLEEKMGPETGDLGLRIGLHSGPVTAGVLRGDKARFQLFGDTMNTTSRIETTGQKNRIHLSEETAELLKAAGKDHWVELREDRVVAKGKGELTTYWLTSHATIGGDSKGTSSTRSETEVQHDQIPSMFADHPSVMNDKLRRLVNWNADVLIRLLKGVVKLRAAQQTQPDPDQKMVQLERQQQGGSVLSEVVESISLPAFERLDTVRLDVCPSVSLEPAVEDQMRSYVNAIASLYRENAFHNLEHASHVVMSVTKLLSRIVAPDLPKEVSADEKALHDHTYGITSDPLTQFAVVYSALIHDVDHQGIPNTQLVKEKPSFAACYNYKSMAEQNSVDIAWDLLMDESFSNLRRAIYCTEAEFRRFRQLVANTVMATDIMDKELGAARKARWELAFSEQPSNVIRNNVNRKATIVIEHLIQASDVAHTMQHWHVYRKWNARLFREMSRAYQEGRAEKDPALSWYQGEIGFFDFYIIPLAKKLKECGVFGVSSDEYLIYAQKNRDEWAVKGKQIVEQMVEESS